jgi:hypothetical protein
MQLNTFEQRFHGDLLLLTWRCSDFDAWPKDNFNAHVDEGGCQAGQAQGPGRTGAAVA